MGRFAHMAKRIDIRSRVDEATDGSIPRSWDPAISLAVIRRREQQLVDREPEHPASGTELIQARLAEARTRQEAEEAEESATG